AGAARFFPERLGERQHEGLRRVVDGHQRAWLEGRGRGDVQHAAALPGEHPVPQQVGELDERADVQVAHAEGADWRALTSCWPPEVAPRSWPTGVALMP